MKEGRGRQMGWGTPLFSQDLSMRLTGQINGRQHSRGKNGLRFLTLF